MIVWFIILELLLIGLGLFALLRPTDMWRVEHFLSVRGGEPTDLYLFMTRIGGGAALAAAVALPIFLAMNGFFSEPGVWW